MTALLPAPPALPCLAARSWPQVPLIQVLTLSLRVRILASGRCDRKRSQPAGGTDGENRCSRCAPPAGWPSWSRPPIAGAAAPGGGRAPAGAPPQPRPERALLDSYCVVLPQPAPEDRRPRARHAPTSTDLGTPVRRSGRRSSASCAPARCRRSAGRGPRKRPRAIVRVVARSGPRPRGGRPQPQSGPAAAASAEPHRIRQRHPRSARARHRRPRAAAGRRHRRARVRQRRRGADRLAGADGALSVRRAENRPAGARLPDRAGRRAVSGAADAGAGRSAQRRSAVRVARRRGRAPLLPRRRRLHDQDQAEGESLRLHPRPRPAAAARRAARRRARQAVHGRRPNADLNPPPPSFSGAMRGNNEFETLRPRRRRGASRPRSPPRRACGRWASSSPDSPGKRKASCSRFRPATRWPSTNSTTATPRSTASRSTGPTRSPARATRRAAAGILACTPRRAGGGTGVREADSVDDGAARLSPAGGRRGPRHA